MSIARMLKAEIVCPSGSDDSLLAELERGRIIHIEDIHEGLLEEYAQLERDSGDEESPNDAELQKAKRILDVFADYQPVQRGLLENFFGSPPFIEENSFQSILSKIDLESYDKRIQDISGEVDSISSEIEKLAELAGVLEPWSALDGTLSSIVRMRYAHAFPVVGTPFAIKALLANTGEAGSGKEIEWIEVDHTDKRVVGILVSTPFAAPEAEDRIKAANLELVRLPDLEEKPFEALRRVNSEAASLQERKNRLEESLRAEIAQNRPLVQAVFDERANAGKNNRTKKKTFHTRNVVVLRGWVLEKDRHSLERLLAERIPSAEVSFEPPKKGENPPVKLQNPAILKPFQTLLEMFGLPTYFGIDPTWFVALAMTLFYSICLGDAGYGAMQVLITLLLLRKFKPAEGTRLFLQLFTEMGVGAVIFGVLTWSFFGMSPGYTPGSPKILGFLPLLSPTTDILVIIAVGAVIGTVFQLGSILMGCYASLKSGDVAGAIFDKLAWFVFLPSFTVLIVTVLFPDLPRSAMIASLCFFIPSAATILLFAGRDSKGIVGRLTVGLISFYGIVGYYGAVSFFGDVLSYLRVAILNLTGGFIAFVANVIGELIMGKGSPIFVAITVVIALLPMILFHVLNLVLSMMGAFVHSLRLNYLESFSRYYGSGGRVFAPLKKEGQYYRFEQ